MEVVETDCILFSSGNFGAHSHSDQFEFHYLIGPRGRFRNGPLVTPLSGNSLVLSRPHEEHEFLSSEARSQPIYFLRFRPQSGDELRLLGDAGKAFGGRPRPVPHLAPVFEQIRHHAGRKDPHAQKAAEAGLLMILHAAASGDFGRDLSTLHPVVDEARDLLDASLEKPISFGVLSRRSGMDPSSFSRLFKRQTGETALGYLRRRRLEAARFALETSDAKVREVAERFQFCDEFHFSKTYRTWCGRSPSEGRREVSAPRKGEEPG